MIEIDWVHDMRQIRSTECGNVGMSILLLCATWDGC